MREEYAQNVKISNIRNQVFLSFPKSELYISLSERNKMLCMKVSNASMAILLNIQFYQQEKNQKGSIQLTSRYIMKFLQIKGG